LTGSGGTVASGGATGTGTGGAAGKAGTTGSGGVTSSGGTTGNGGTTGTGGVTGTGGSAGSGGAAGKGGSTGTGGNTSSGGATGTGGSAGVAGSKGGATGTGGSATGGVTGTGGSTSGPTISTQGITCTPETWDAAPIGWATISGGTTGGGSATPTTVTTLSQLNTAAGGSNAAVIHVSGSISGVVNVGSNKTIWGLCGAKITGSIDLSGSSNVIIRNLTVVGYNCSDSPSDCSGGHDAIHIQGGDKHLWFDHLDVSDGSDGNLDISHGCDFVTVSWTKFHYSSKRTDPVAGSSGHRFCNLIGHSDSNGSEDSGHLNTTFHHVWWADNVNQRMPRVRFGKVHLFNNLYTASGDAACIELGVSANIRYENNVFVGTSNDVDSSHSNSASVIQGIGNIGSNTNIGGSAFTPGYAYTLDAASSVQSAVQGGAGPR
jgi:pectate lyase